jgi:hypothetical protein
MTTVAGVSVRLAGLDALNRKLQPGDRLVARVLANDPVLELQLYDDPPPDARPANTRPLTLSDHPAMRLDPAELRTIILQVPSAAVLARSWQGQADTWSLFPVHVWSGVQWGGMRMNLVFVRPDGGLRRSPIKRRPRAVRIELLHPLLGCIVFEVEWRSGGIQLSLAVEEATAQAVRSALPAIVSALKRANLRLTRVQMAWSRTAVLRTLVPEALSRASITGDGSELGLFRAAAEIAVALLNPESRRC